MHYLEARDPYSYLTHFIGGVLSVIALIVLMIHGFYKHISFDMFICITLFGLSMIALYCASSGYHWYQGSASKIERLRKIDHAMIFALIAGSYTPMVMRYFEKPYGYYYLAIIWIVALVGIVLKIKWINMPRFISTLIYILFGASILFQFDHLCLIPFHIFIFIILAGLFYIVGAIIYIIKKPNISKRFGFHEIFHLFILLGSLCYFIAVFQI